MVVIFFLFFSNKKLREISICLNINSYPHTYVYIYTYAYIYFICHHAKTAENKLLYAFDHIKLICISERINKYFVKHNKIRAIAYKQIYKR